jgi:oxaloacetate decarboxylase alpha subunit
MQRLTATGLAHRMHAFAHECALVRSEIGAPPMLAPFAGPIAEQALLHLKGAPRYTEIRPGVRRAIQQVYGAAAAVIDSALLMRVGALTNTPRRSLAALRALYPAATDASLVLEQVCGVKPDAQPRPKPAEALRYVATTPEDSLLAGLVARSARYHRLRVRGPGVSIELQGREG